MSEQFNTIDKYINVKTAFGYQKKPNPNYIATNGEIPTVQRTIAQVDADRMNQDSINVQNTTEAKGFGVLGGYSRKGKKMRSKKRRNNSKKSLRSRRHKRRQTKRSRR
jgi:hypothetical protein